MEISRIIIITRIITTIIIAVVLLIIIIIIYSYVSRAITLAFMRIFKSKGGKVVRSDEFNMGRLWRLQHYGLRGRVFLPTVSALMGWKLLATWLPFNATISDNILWGILLECSPLSETTKKWRQI